MNFLLKKRISRSRGGDLTLIIFLCLFTVVMMLPLVLAISTSLKPVNEFWVFPPTFFPKHPTLENYSSLFALMTDSLVPMSRYVFNTFFVTIVGTIGHIILSSMAAYVLSKYKFPGSKGFFTMIKLSLMFSGAVVGVPHYLIMNKVGLIDSYGALILPAFSGTLGLFLMKQFMDQMIPMSILESADIDGASEWIKFFKIVMPMVKPAWLTLMIFCVKDLWNTGASPFIYSEQLKTLHYALNQIVAGGLARQGAGAAIVILLLAAPLIIFIVTQSNIIETMATSGMKD